MQWEDLTGDEFESAIAQSDGVCLVALSVVERHGHHLPTGTDMFIGQEVLKKVADREPVVLFPTYVFTQIAEARHCPGTISIDPDLMVRLLDNTCREIARNGFGKIVLVNCHGGNRNFLPFFMESQLTSPRDYTVYVVNPIVALFGRDDVPWPPETEGHAGPGETSMMLASRPELVDMVRIPDAAEGKPLRRLRALEEVGAQTGLEWYGDYPNHYMGDATPATADSGTVLLEAMADHVTQAVRQIKLDDETKRLQRDFYAGSRTPHVRSGP